MTLAEALWPLHAGYLRRLSEMVARLPEGAALTEQVLRDGEGRLAVGEGGLPLRFDVADARDGHTYEVHGAHPDAPLAESVRVGRIEARLSPGNWEELPVGCVFAGDPPAEDLQALEDVLRSFAALACSGGFAAPRADRWTGRAHGVRIERKDGELVAVFDLGTCEPAALEALCQALSGYGEDRAPLALVRIG